MSVQMWARSHVERQLQEEWETCKLVQGSVGLTRSVHSDLMRHVEGIADDVGPMITAVYGGSTPHEPRGNESAAEDVA